MCMCVVMGVIMCDGWICDIDGATIIVNREVIYATIPIGDGGSFLGCIFVFYF